MSKKYDRELAKAEAMSDLIHELIGAVDAPDQLKLPLRVMDAGKALSDATMALVKISSVDPYWDGDMSDNDKQMLKDVAEYLDMVRDGIENYASLLHIDAKPFNPFKEFENDSED